MPVLGNEVFSPDQSRSDQLTTRQRITAILDLARDQALSSQPRNHALLGNLSPNGESSVWQRLSAVAEYASQKETRLSAIGLLFEMALSGNRDAAREIPHFTKATPQMMELVLKTIRDLGIDDSARALGLVADYRRLIGEEPRALHRAQKIAIYELGTNESRAATFELVHMLESSDSHIVDEAWKWITSGERNGVFEAIATLRLAKIETDHPDLIHDLLELAATEASIESLNALQAIAVNPEQPGETRIKAANKILAISRASVVDEAKPELIRWLENIAYHAPSGTVAYQCARACASLQPPSKQISSLAKALHSFRQYHRNLDALRGFIDSVEKFESSDANRTALTLLIEARRISEVKYAADAAIDRFGKWAALKAKITGKV